MRMQLHRQQQVLPLTKTTLRHTSTRNQLRALINLHQKRSSRLHTRDHRKIPSRPTTSSRNLGNNTSLLDLIDGVEGCVEIEAPSDGLLIVRDADGTFARLPGFGEIAGLEGDEAGADVFVVELGDGSGNF
ncbi:MAG: hypothetical protein Q9226_003253 [Calogaya cf. arnoldii]